MNYVVRKVTPQGDVSTVAGTPGQPGSRDGNPANNEAAMFNHPSGIAVDYYGNLFVCDTYNNTIRKVSKKGEVSTIAGESYFVLPQTKILTIVRNGRSISVNRR
jgi:secreted PhoX family phosphatase